MMVFNGFTEKTIEYFFNIYSDNTKSNFEANRAIYDAHVKAPLRALYDAVLPAMLDLDPDICARAARCVSGAYNDLRYAKSDPIKHYMYLHFCAGTQRENDVPGFFMDASFSGWRYGLQVYHRTAAGMTKLREAALCEDKRFLNIVRAVERDGLFKLDGDDYKRDRFPDVRPPLKTWLNKKSWRVAADRPPDGVFMTAGLADELISGFQSLKALYVFLTEALNA